MLSEKEAKAVEKLCAGDFSGMMLAFGLIGEDGYYRASIMGRLVVPFWSNREEIERIQMETPDMAKFDIADLDVIFLVANQFQEIESQGYLVGINWGAEKNEWWGQPVAEVEDVIRTNLRWPK